MMKNRSLVIIMVVLIVGMFFVRTASAFCSTTTDYFGYRCYDTSNPSSYEWHDITSDTNSGYWKDLLNYSDDQNVSYIIPSNLYFTYYGIKYNKIYISNNGLIFFNIGDSKYLNQQIYPHKTKTIHNFIAPYWDDLTTMGAQNSAGSIYADIDTSAGNEKLIVEWYNNEHFTLSDQGISFEVILGIGNNNRGDIKFVYNNSANYCCQFGNVTQPYPMDGPNFSNGGSATVGIEGPETSKQPNGVQYSFDESIISNGLVIEFRKIIPKADLTLSKRGPEYMAPGMPITYTLSYANIGNSQINRAELTDILDLSKILNPVPTPTPGNIIKWNMILEPYPGPQSSGSQIVSGIINASLPQGDVILNTASIKDLDDFAVNATAEFTTKVNDLNFPEGIEIYPASGSKSGTPSVYFGNNLTFQFKSPCRASQVLVNISVWNNYNNPPTLENFSYPMEALNRDSNGYADLWNYTQNRSFYSLHVHGSAAVIFVYSGGTCGTGSSAGTKTDIYVDPAGYIYDAKTGKRIRNATVWLQRPDGFGTGGWENVPVMSAPKTALMLPNKNPLISTEAGQYQWDTVKGVYRINVTAEGYYPANSIVIAVPPPVFDLNMGLKPVNKTPGQGFNVIVKPIKTKTEQGEIVEFLVTLTANETLAEEEFIELSVIDLDGNPIIWNTRFSDNMFKIGPYSDSSRRVKTVNLEIEVPSGADNRDYFLKIKGNGFLPNNTVPTIPDGFLESVESRDIVVTVPGFTIIALLVIIIVGMRLSYKRRKGN